MLVAALHIHSTLNSRSWVLTRRETFRLDFDRHTGGLATRKNKPQQRGDVDLGIWSNLLR